MTIYYLPLEPLENRYTKDWFWQFDEVFKAHHIDYEKIPFDMATKKTNGVDFLDWGQTLSFKLKQLQSLMSYDISDDDWVFVADGEMPGLEALEYYRKMTNKRFKIAAIWHAGSYDHTDLTAQKGLGRIGSLYEPVLFDITDRIFVATKHHKEMIVDRRIVDKDKIFVTGLPLDCDMLQAYRKPYAQKDIDVMFGGRMSYEKGYDVIERMKRAHPDLKFVDAIKQNYTREQWLEALSRSKLLVAPSRQETFGYCIVEAMAMETDVMVSENPTFKDYVPQGKSCHMLDFERCLTARLNNKPSLPLAMNVKKYQYQDIITKMLKVMGCA